MKNLGNTTLFAIFSVLVSAAVPGLKPLTLWRWCKCFTTLIELLANLGATILFAIFSFLVLTTAQDSNPWSPWDDEKNVLHQYYFALHLPTATPGLKLLIYGWWCECYTNVLLLLANLGATTLFAIFSVLVSAAVPKLEPLISGWCCKCHTMTRQMFYLCVTTYGEPW